MIQEKSRLLLRLEQLIAAGAGRDAVELASDVAALEGFIVLGYLDKGRSEEATINLISQAGCLGRARRTTEAYRILTKAHQLTKVKKTQQWIEHALDQLRETSLPASIFLSAVPRIRDNAKLRRPQIGAYDAAREHFSKSNEHAIIQLPVGCGKTGTMAILPFGIARGRVLVVAPNLEIKNNLARTLDYTRPESFLRATGVLSNSHGPAAAELSSAANLMDCDKSDMVVTNIQQLVAADSTKWLSKLSPDYFDMIFLDEGHHNVAPTWKEVIGRFSSAKLTSFTATPLRADGQKVEGKRIYRFPIADAIREGYIKDLASRKLEPLEISFTLKGQKRHHTLAEILKLREETWFSRGVALSAECNRHIVDASIQCLNELREHSRVTHQIIASACSIDHARSIQALYEERNQRAAVIHSNLDMDEQENVKDRLKAGKLDAIVHIQMLGEGADYPTLSVAAIFRPYRHVVPYVQFVGRIMRVVEQNSPGHPDNRGFVVSHAGLNIDRWWDELRDLDEDDQSFFEEIAKGEHNFASQDSALNEGTRRRFAPAMRVIEERITHFVQQRFLPEDTKALVDDLVASITQRGINIEEIGLSREMLEKKLTEAREQFESKGQTESIEVSPQRARQLARRRLNERVKSASKQLLAELGLAVTGMDLPKLFPRSGTINNLAAAIVLLNNEVWDYLGVGPNERDLLDVEPLRRAHDNMDEIIDRAASNVRKKMEK
jgi:superfamily II DNA or RNA helicase